MTAASTCRTAGALPPHIAAISNIDAGVRYFSRILVDLGYVKEADLNTGLAAQRGYELINLEGVKIPDDVIKAVRKEFPDIRLMGDANSAYTLADPTGAPARLVDTRG